MEMDLEGFVQGSVPLAPTPPQKCLLPLYEAISNSIHSIHTLHKDNRQVRGRIEIMIHRDKSQGVLRHKDEQKIDLHPIEGFTIIDNGIGFDTANFDSFKTAFSQLKRHLGAKGRGRFMWLKVFARAHVDSIFSHDGEQAHRKFTFTLKDGCTGGKTPTSAKGSHRKTVVRLERMLSPFKDHCPKHTEAIAGHIVRRFVQYLALPTSPTMLLTDDDTSFQIVLNDWFDNLKLKNEHTHFRVNDNDFELNHLLLKKQGDLKHELHFCAHKQAVATEALDARLPDLRSPLSEAGTAVIYHGYISSSTLDESVNPERTDFDKIADSTLPHSGAIPWNAIVDHSVAEAAKFLDPYTQTIRAEKDRRVTEYVQTQAPWYRHVVTQKPEVVAAIPPGASSNDIDIALYQGSKAIEFELRRQASELLQAGEAADDPDDYRKKLDQFLEQFGDVGRDQLAKYVAHRKAILSFLFDRLRLRADGKHHFEKDIHQVIFPMRATSDDVEPDRMNLWIIDERLAFHYYLASDKPLKSIDPITIDSGKELDLLIFDRPFFFGEGDVDIGAAVIIEFKRPMTDDRDPIRQVFGYVRTIRTGTVTKDGRTLKVKPGTPFYAYILCDLTARMREYAEDAGLKVTPDDEGFIGFNTTHEVYLEVISYQKAISDARKRNAILFHKLGLPPDLKKPAPTETETSDTQHRVVPADQSADSSVVDV